MIFTPLSLQGAWLIELERRPDARGHFARVFCIDEFTAHGLPGGFVQCNVSYNAKRGTLRGMHWQGEPHPEGKLVRCSRGEIYDVIVDMRPDSPTRYQWHGVALSAENGTSLYIPPGFAHGFQTLTDDSDVFYQMTETYWPELARGARWDDPAFGITWPIAAPILSDRDCLHPLVTR